MQDFQRAVLMGDPEFFRVQGGANPHTRTRFGTRKRVDRELAILQWKNLFHTLQELDVRILVVPPDARQPGLVYPANAGFMKNLDVPCALNQKIFYLANLLPSRAGEKPHYYKLLEANGIRTAAIDPQFRFEGEADFFPVADSYLLTFGAIERQRFVPCWGVPPWKRIYGFRTDRRVIGELQPIVGEREILELELRLEAHYHGDTALCAFGKNRDQLLVYEDALAPKSLARLRAKFGERILALSPADAKRYAANSFCLQHGNESVLILPQGVSQHLLDQLRERGITPLTVDVSEFLKKGGGSVKCMIGDLGWLPRLATHP